MSKTVDELKKTAMNANSNPRWKEAMDKLSQMGEEGQAALAEIHREVSSNPRRKYAMRKIED